MRASGAYMPSIDEEIVERVSAHTITERDALMLRAKRDFVDVYGAGRRAREVGDEAEPPPLSLSLLSSGTAWAGARERSGS